MDEKVERFLKEQEEWEKGYNKFLADYKELNKKWLKELRILRFVVGLCVVVISLFLLKSLLEGNYFDVFFKVASIAFLIFALRINGITIKNIEGRMEDGKN